MVEWGNAVWIGSAHPFDLHEVYLDFRSPVVRGRAGEAVELCISADSRYKLWLNGSFVARGPARSYPHAQSFDQLDLSDAWRAGDNVLTVRVYQPGYAHFSYVHRAAAGMLAHLSINGEVKLTSGAGWRARRSGVFSSDVARVSIYGSGVEVQDLALEDSWRAVDYSAEHWHPARVVAAANGHIWRGLTERVTPMPLERSAEIRLVESRLNDVPAPIDEPHANLTHAWRHGQTITFPTDTYGWIRPKIAPSQTALWLFDLGRAHTCQGNVAIRGAAGGERLTISYADKMVDGQLILSDPQTYCRVRLTDSFALRAGEQVVEPFSMRGGRFVLFQIAGDLGPDLALRPSVRVADYPLTVTKRLVTDSPQLTAIVAMCENTVRACLQDSFVDCNWRESSQWLGDGLIQAKTLAAMCDDFRPMRKLLLDVAAGQLSGGMLPSIAPGEVHAYTIPRYACMWIELLHFYVQTSGDSALVAPKSPVRACLLKLLNFYEAHGSGALHTTPVGMRHYIDWSPTSQNDPHCVYNLHVVLALQRAHQLLSQLNAAAASGLHDMAQSLLELCRTTYFEDGIWWDDVERTTFSQLAAAMALLVGAVAPDEQAALLDGIVARALNQSDEYVAGQMVLASPFMHHYVFEALAKFGRYQAIVDIITLRWGRWASAGGATTWENWNIDFPDGSACHAFSAHPRYHLANALQSLG